MARALAKADRIEICSDASYAFSSYGPKARAAIEEMREPTHAMSREFFIAWTMAERRGFDFPESPVVYAWNRMIDAMLDDGTSAALGEGE